jgi:hypothetical protein
LMSRATDLERQPIGSGISYGVGTLRLWVSREACSTPPTILLHRPRRAFFDTGRRGAMQKMKLFYVLALPTPEMAERAPLAEDFLGASPVNLVVDSVFCFRPIFP